MLYDVLDKFSVRRLDTNQSFTLHTVACMSVYILCKSFPLMNMAVSSANNLTLAPSTHHLYRLKIAIGPRLSLGVLHMLFFLMMMRHYYSKWIVSCLSNSFWKTPMNVPWYHSDQVCHREYHDLQYQMPFLDPDRLPWHISHCQAYFSYHQLFQSAPV